MAVARREVLRGMLTTGASLATLTMPAAAAPKGTMTWGVHITLPSRWLDPAETALCHIVAGKCGVGICSRKSRFSCAMLVQPR